MRSRIEVLSWQDIRQDVHVVNPELAAIIDNMDPPQSYELLKVNYAYGDLIIDQGIPQLPIDGEGLAPLDSTKVPVLLQKMLSYAAIPLFVTLENDTEVFVDNGQRIIPLNLFHPGSLLGLFETLDFIFQHYTKPTWSVSAGARTVIMLPKVTNLTGLKKLAIHYELPSTIRLKTLADHWQIFKTIANHHHFKQPWFNTVVFFSKAWFQKKSFAIELFKNYLFKQAWEQAGFTLRNFELSATWETLSQVISQRNLKLSSYLADHVKHLLTIAFGRAPGLYLARTQTTIPLNGIQQSFIDIYNLKSYAPLIMHIYPLNTIWSGEPLYYSLSFPTLIEGSPLHKHHSTVITDLRDIRHLISTLLKSHRMTLFSKNLTQQGAIDFRYYHIEEDPYSEITSSKCILEEDGEFSQAVVEWKKRVFCDTSPFWRGCIRIQRRSTS